MAFGFSPKHEVYFPIEDLTPEHFLILALEAAKQKGWNVGPATASGFRAYTSLSLSSYGEEISVTLDNGIATIKSACTGNQFMDWGKNKRNVESFISAYDELKASLTIDEIAQKHEALQPQLTAEETSGSSAVKNESGSGILSLIIPRPGFFITPILLNLNIFIFILMAISGVSIWEPESESLLKWGANFKPVTLEGEGWRLLTSCFVHIGIFHLLMNMYALLYIGLMLEPYLGKLRFAAAYLLTGIAASATSLWWHDDLAISAGASGAIFGMYGVFFAMLTTNLIEKSARKQLLTSIAIFIGYNLLNGLKAGIDNAAHIGGLLSGLVAGYVFYLSLKRPADSKLKYSTVGVLCVLVIATTFALYSTLPNDVGQYDKRIQAFVTMEAEALSVYSLPEGTPKEMQLSQLKEKGIHNWKKSIKLIEELDELNLPESVHQRNKALLKYCDLRLKSSELAYRGIEEGTSEYNDDIEEYNNEIEATITSIQIE
jgi:rhomboid protease GluP